jgi:predicted Fe-S protein YdhL (DUF1289 family)
MIRSPCVRVCSLNQDQICVGCGMTIRDIKIWRSTDDQTREEIIRESRIRASSMQKMRDEGFHDDGQK